MRSVLRLPNDDWRKVLFVALGVSLVCSVLVSSVHLLLLPQRENNLARHQEEIFASFLNAIPGLSLTLSAASADSMKQAVVDLSSGWYTNDFDISEVDMQAFAKDASLSIELPNEVDIARLKRRSNYAPVYVLELDGKPEYVILSLFGYGYQSLIKAWIILGSDLNTVHGLTIVEQNETPGLGAKIVDENWLSAFSEKTLRSPAGDRVLAVARAGTASEYEVDGITGATRTGNGISNMINFWFGDYGYRAFLERLAEAS